MLVYLYIILNIFKESALCRYSVCMELERMDLCLVRGGVGDEGGFMCG